MFPQIIVKEKDFPETYHALLDDYKRLIRDYNQLIYKLESLENERDLNQQRKEMAVFFDSGKWFP